MFLYIKKKKNQFQLKKKSFQLKKITQIILA